MSIIGEIPARLGSQRVGRKNLRPLHGRPLITYAIEAAKAATTLSEVYVNSESDEIGRLALAHDVKYYKRPMELAGDTTSQDAFHYDFIQRFKPDVLVMVNPVSPFIEGTDIDAMVRHFLSHPLDTLIAVREEHLHAFYRERPVNCTPESSLPRTQDLHPIQLCVWSIGIWRGSAFVEQYETKGHAAFCGRVGFYPMDRFKSVKISTEEDFRMAEVFMEYKARWNSLDVMTGREAPRILA